ncbi:MAG: DUF2344 domain-containing protein, partial [Desulfamplus sp.]|nr:DUF2344 domain-containing protein [Desulfamplus sp.]
VTKLNQVLPPIITITRCLYSANLKNRKNSEQLVTTSYRINLNNFTITQNSIDDFMALSQYVVEKLNFKGVQREIDLRKVTKNITILKPNELEMTLINDGQRTIRPSEILTEVFNLPDSVLRSADTLKLKR